jgi:hypothetical protein
MSDWSADDLSVAGIVMAVEGCGGNDDQVAVLDAEGRELRLLGVRAFGGRVEIVVDGAAR